MFATRLRPARLLAAAVTLMGFIGSTPVAAADDAFVCQEATQEKCDWENQNLDLFVKAHDAFDRGREKGDLSEARKYALELIFRKDERHGKAIMKYVYMQIGMGVHKNYVEAYRWLSEDLAAGTEYKRLNLESTRERLAKLMTPEQLAEAKQR